MKPRTSMLIGVGLVLISVCAVQLGSVVGKSTFDRADPASVTFGRLAIAAAVLLLVARPNLLAFTGRTWAWMLLLGATMAGMNFTFYLAIERIPVGVAVTIELIGPLTVSLVQSKRFRELIWVLIALLGIVLIGLQSFRGVIDPVGILLAAFAGVCWGAYIIASKQVGQRVAGLKGLAIALMVSAIVVLPFAIVPFVRDVSADPTVLLPMGLIALLSSLLAYGVELVALRRIPTRVFGVMMALEPAVAAAFAVLLLHEAVGGLEIVAIALVMIASAGVAYTAAPKADPIVTGTFGTIVPAHESFDVTTGPIDIIEQFDDDDPQNIDPNDELT
ncbi:EamA family transporter [Agrococcus casei]|uniref:EamA family transporter n=1 Tax=Agrococcus casei TaxID=343512 RepID=UPI003F915250